MKNSLWKFATVAVVLTMLVSGLAMPLTGCGAKTKPTPVPVKPAASATPMPAALPTDTPVLSEAEGPVPPTAEVGEQGPEPGRRVIDDFEGGDFDDRWWSYADEGTISFTCAPDQPGHASAHAMQLAFEVGADGWPGCGIDVDPGQWEEAGGLSFFWRADQAGLTMFVTLVMEDQTQTNPETEGMTPFQIDLQTPGEEWTPVTL